MLTCYRTRRRLSAHLDGALDERAARTVAVHVETCARCRGEFEALRRLHSALRETVAAAVPTDWTGFWPGIVRGIERERQSAVKPVRQGWQGRRALAHPRLAFGSALAVAVVALLTLWQVLIPPTSPAEAVIVNAANSDHPGASVMVYSPPERDMAVVWVFDSD